MKTKKEVSIITSGRIKKLVQNYFELHGDFTGIEFAQYFDELQDMASQSQLPLTEYCYAMLGGSKGSAGYEAKFRKAVEKDKAACAEDLGKLATYRSINKRFGEEITALCQYYRLGLDKFISFNGSVMTFPDFVQLAKVMHKDPAAREQLGSSYKSKDLAKAFVNDDRLKNVLVHKYEKSSVCAVCADTLFSKKDLKEEDFNSIHRVALTRLVRGSLNYPQEFLLSAEKFATLPFTNTKLYYTMLVWAAARDMTYADVLEDLGFHVADLNHLYNKQVALFLPVGSNVLVFDSEVGSGGYEIVPLDVFELRYKLGMLTGRTEEDLTTITAFN